MAFRTVIALCLLALGVAAAPASAVAGISLYQRSAILEAARANDADAVRDSLARGENPNVQDQGGQTPLIFICFFA